MNSHNGNWSDKLTVRAANVLNNAGCWDIPTQTWDKEKAIELVTSGKIKLYRNAGKLTLREISKALGLESLHLGEELQPHIKRCPHCKKKIKVRTALFMNE